MNTIQQFTEVEFGSQHVKVPRDGYYDRFHMQPNLNEVAQDPAAGNIEFFRRIPKQMINSRVGPVWAPNFYYRSSSVQLLMLAPIAHLRTALPSPLEPLQALPRFGLVALTFFSYVVCDNDPYDEVSVAVVIRQPGATGSQALELIDAMRRRSFFAHVLALPVNTEIARVRGVYGYQFPKWLTTINLTIQSEVNATLLDSNGKTDLSLSLPTPKFKQVKPQSHLESKTMIHQVDGIWHKTLVQSNTLTFAQQLLPRQVKFKRYDGPVSQLLDGLGASTILRLDVVKDAQLVLNMPMPFKTWEQI